MATRKERRRYQRLSWPVTIQIHPAGDLMAMWQDVSIVDVGAGGCRLMASERLEKGDRLELRMHLPTWQAASEVPVRVIWVRTVNRERYDVGVEFIDVTLEQQVRIDEWVRFLAQHAA